MNEIYGKVNEENQEEIRVQIIIEHVKELNRREQRGHNMDATKYLCFQWKKEREK